MLRLAVVSLLAFNVVFAAGPVRTALGQVQGVPTADPSVTVFRGIPYAAPPVGDLRWRPPQPAAPWKGIRMADRFSRSCMQASPSRLGPWTEEYMDQSERSEDCLYLNVWTAGTTGKRPVFLWIHGGAFDQGSTSVSLYDGEALARKGVVVVTINYRLGVFGFLTHPELTKESDVRSSGNYGLLDAIAALKWVQANIAAFGGDPGRVTIGGQSAGAMAVSALVASPLAKGLFHQTIVQSGSSHGNRLRSLADSEGQGVKLVAAKGVQSIRELRAMPVYQVMAPVEGASFRWGPVEDGWMLPEKVGTVFEQGKQNDVPTMTGWCADEGSSDAKYGKRTPEEFQQQVRSRTSAAGLADEFLRLYPAATQEEASRSQKESALHQSFVSTLLWARQRAAHGKTPVYAYLWTRSLPGPNREQYGAFHSSELPFMFGSLSGAKRPWTQEDRDIADKTTSYWANFIKTGNPNGGGLPEWPVFDLNRPVAMELGERFAPRPIASPEQVKLFERILGGQAR